MILKFFIEQFAIGRLISWVSLFCHSPGGQSVEALSINQYKLSYYKNLVVVFVIKKKLAFASYTEALEFRNGKSFRRVTEEGYSISQVNEV